MLWHHSNCIMFWLQCPSFIHLSLVPFLIFILVGYEYHWARLGTQTLWLCWVQPCIIPVSSLYHPCIIPVSSLCIFTLLSTETIGCCERFCQLFRRVQRSRIHSANQRESMQDDSGEWMGLVWWGGRGLVEGSRRRSTCGRSWWQPAVLHVL